jgi:membrane-associated phospholipid phosphatase
MSSRKHSARRRLTPVEQVDLSVARRAALDKRSRTGRNIARFAELGDQPPMILLSAGVIAAGALTRNAKLARTGLRMLAAHSLTTMAKLLGKGLIDRTRPEETLRNGDYRLEEGTSKDGRLRSMPSGHSAGVTGVALAATRDYPGLAIPAASAGGAIMLAQLPSKNHFLSDIIVGATIGFLSAAIATALIPRLEKIRPEPAQPRSKQP